MQENDSTLSFHVTEEGDTFLSMSVKYNITILQLKEYNSITTLVPGNILRIPKINEIFNIPHPIDTQLFNWKKPITGTLFLQKNNIMFKPYKRKKRNKLKIPLLNIVSTAIGPHPADEGLLPDDILDDNSLCLLTIYYLTNIKEVDDINEVVFAGTLSEMLHFQKVVEHLTRPIQDENRFEPPPISRYISRRKSNASELVLLEENEKLDENGNPSKIETNSHIQSHSLMNQSFPIQEGSSEIITSLMDSLEIKNSFPRRFRHYNWSLKFRLSQDGASFTAFQSKVKPIKVALLLIRTNYNDIIGGFASHGIMFDARKAYPSGECFVFTFTPSFNAFKWAHTTNFFFSSTAEEMIVGGGGAAAIWIDHRFLSAFSEKCNAFNSPPLASKVEFKISEIEVWSIGSS
ncbi:TLD family protein [Tritrichomonas foetus]|uniref:Oxidation resistance protein 1 n=1 Tax=Tritrichomonas foetus TaxID=1144522 RepID=A0A1J4KBR7_9EUKA|nr:TLD family protein [Tritrichomonas foetus]|eukprot:OHT07126.1 TLD family protein [Tritrichomonas foetus]